MALSREQKPPLYAILIYMAPSLLTLVTLKYQGKTESLFEKNPAPTWSFVIATCVYCLTVGGMEQIQTPESKWFRRFRLAALASGVFSIVSLISIFLPYPGSVVPLITCIILQFVAFTWSTLSCVYSLIHVGITSVSDHIRAKLENLREEASSTL